MHMRTCSKACASERALTAASGALAMGAGGGRTVLEALLRCLSRDDSRSLLQHTQPVRV